MSWEEFKALLTKEFTDKSYHKLLNSINELSYLHSEDSLEFSTQIKYKLALLEITAGPDRVPNSEKPLRDKIPKGMPKDCHD